MGFMNQFAGWLHRGKDASIGFVFERFMQRTFEKYGRMLDFKIDSQQKTARVELLLKGEREPIVINVQRYEIVSEPAGTFLVIGEATASREWITTALDQFIRGKRIAVPEAYAKLIKLAV